MKLFERVLVSVVVWGFLTALATVGAMLVGYALGWKTFVASDTVVRWLAGLVGATVWTTAALLSWGLWCVTAPDDEPAKEPSNGHPPK